MESHTHEPKKSFFEKYQTFFSLIIAGLLIAGGIVLSKTLPAQNSDSGTNQNAPQGQTEDQVKNELVSIAKNIGLDKKEFTACLDTRAQEAKITDALTLAGRSGVTGTPTFFVITRTFNADNTVATEKQFPIVGARDKDTIMKAIESGTAPADQPANPGERIILSDSDHYTGAKNAAVTIVEYSDIDCPFCKRAKPVVDEILQSHPEYGFVYRHSPLAQLHPWAPYKAEATECAFAQGGENSFWKYLDIISK